MAEKRPADSAWTEVPWPMGPKADASAWRHGPITVLSELADAEYPDGSGSGPQWLVSISAKGRRPKPKQVRRALRALVGAEEDCHHPGVARHFWRPLDPAKRVDCQCKVEELTVVEPDGYRWTTPVDGSCRGCEYEAMAGVPCPVHGPADSRGNVQTRARQLAAR